MSVFDLQQRSQAILKKYEKYDSEIQAKSKSSDPFQEEFFEVEAEVEKLMEAAEEITLETNRSVIAGKYAEIRRAKNVLLTEAVESLKKKVKKGKGVTKQLQQDRQQQISDMIERIYAIPDGMSSIGTKRPQRYGAKNGLGSKANPVLINGVESHVGNTNPLYHQHNEVTQEFERHAQMAFVKQDETLGRIEQGVSTLGEMARNMGEEINRHDPIIDDIEQQMDKVTKSLKTNNAKLKGLVHRMRSSRNFCVDVILICILLAIGSYLFATFAKKK